MARCRGSFEDRPPRAGLGAGSLSRSRFPGAIPPKAESDGLRSRAGTAGYTTKEGPLGVRGPGTG